MPWFSSWDRFAFRRLYKWEYPKTQKSWDPLTRLRNITKLSFLGAWSTVRDVRETTTTQTAARLPTLHFAGHSHCGIPARRIYVFQVALRDCACHLETGHTVLQKPRERVTSLRIPKSKEYNQKVYKELVVSQCLIWLSTCSIHFADTFTQRQFNASSQLHHHNLINIRTIFNWRDMGVDHEEWEPISHRMTRHS